MLANTVKKPGEAKICEIRRPIYSIARTRFINQKHSNSTPQAPEISHSSYWKSENLEQVEIGILESHFSVSALDFLVGGVPGDAEDLVRIPPDRLRCILLLRFRSASWHSVGSTPCHHTINPSRSSRNSHDRPTDRKFVHRLHWKSARGRGNLRGGDRETLGEEREGRHRLGPLSKLELRGVRERRRRKRQEASEKLEGKLSFGFPKNNCFFKNFCCRCSCDSLEPLPQLCKIRPLPTIFI